MRIAGGLSELIITSAIAAIAVGAFALRCAGAGSDVIADGDREEPLMPVPGAPTPTERAEWYSIGRVIGPEWAPVQIVEFGNFTCEYCKQFYHALDTILERYPGQISVRWIHHIPAGLDPSSRTVRLASASECGADQVSFATIYHAFFRADRLPTSKGELVRFADSVGIPDLNRFAACMDALSHRQILARHTSARLARQFDLTPTWFANDHLFIGAPPSVATIDSVVLSLLRP